MRSASPKPETLWPSRWREVDMEGSPHSHQGEGTDGYNLAPEDNKTKAGEEKADKSKGEPAPVAKTPKRKVYIHRCPFSHNCSHRKNCDSEPSYNITSEDIDKSRSHSVVSTWDTPKIENTHLTSLNDKDYCQLISDVDRLDILSRTGRENKSVQDYGVYDNNKFNYIERGLPLSEGRGREVGEGGGRGVYGDSVYSKELSQRGLDEPHLEGPPRSSGSSPYTPSLSFSQLPSRITSLRTESPPLSSASPVSVSDTANLLASWSHPANASNHPRHASPFQQPSSHCHLHKESSPSPLPPPTTPSPSSSPRPSSSCPCDKQFVNRPPTSEEITPNFRKYCRNFFLETLCPGATEEKVRHVVSAVECLEDRVYLNKAKSKMDYCYQLAKKLCCIQEEMRQMSKRSSEQIPIMQEKSKEKSS